MSTPKAPSLLDGVNIKDILAPKATPVEINGHTIGIYPLPGREYIHIVGDIEVALGLLKTVVEETGGDLFSEQTIYASIPLIAKHMIPSMTRIVAAALRTEVEFIEDVAMEAKIEIFKAVIKAEKIVELAKNGQGLLSIIRSTPDLTPTNPAE